MLRYSLASLATVIVVLSIYSAALAQGDDLWPQISVTLTVAVLLFATLAAVFSRSRTFAMGFSIVGWLYFTIVFSGFAGVRENLLTQTAINWLYGQVHAPGTQGVSTVTFQPARAYTSLGGTVTRYVPVQSTSSAPRPVPEYALRSITTSTGVQQTIALTAIPAAPTPALVSPYHFAQIGHSLWVVLIGAMGGVVAQVLYARSRHTLPTN